MSCAVKSCRNYKSRRREGISFFRFPRCEILMKAWIDAIGLEKGWTWSKNKYVCSQHFHQADIADKCGQRGHRALKRYAVPSLLLTETLTDTVEPQEPVSQRKLQMWANMCDRKDLLGGNVTFLCIPGTSKCTNDEQYSQGIKPFLPDAADVSEEEDLTGTSKGTNDEEYSHGIKPFLPDAADVSEEEDFTDTSEEDSPPTTPTLVSSSAKTELHQQTPKLNYLEPRVHLVQIKPIQKDETRETFNYLCDKYLTPEQSAFTKIHANEKGRAIITAKIFTNKIR